VQSTTKNSTPEHQDEPTFSSYHFEAHKIQNKLCKNNDLPIATGLQHQQRKQPSAIAEFQERFDASIPMFPLFDKAYKPSLMAQLLNDEAALLIQQGDCEQAITHLIKALRLYEDVADSFEACSCHHCRLESCIARSKRAPMQPHPMCSPCSGDELDDDDQRTTNPTTGGYVYSQPIFCAPTFSHEGHHPGVTLMMIIIFNLALAHHLVSISPSHPAQLFSSPSADSQLRHKRLSKALQLYELFYQLQMEREIFSTQAMLAVANNVGEIHRLVGNQGKYKLCLEHLLSCIMLVVEDLRESSANRDLDNSSSRGVNGRASRRSSQHGNLSCRSEEMQGFLRNASKLVLRDNCAGAA
jgi:tetratricopeptide (TPR) repeat protein